MQATQLMFLGKSVTAKHPIPPPYLEELLPDTKLSVHELIHFKFPPPPILHDQGICLQFREFGATNDKQ